MGPSVYIFDEIEAFTEADLEVAYRKVSAERLQKARWYKRTIDRKLSVIAELLLIHATGLRNCSVQHTDRGKPRFSDPSKPHYNLSHCTLAVACAVGKGEVGIDVEPFASYDEEVALQVFSAAEQTVVMDNPREFARYWATKESYLKYTGEGLTDELQQLLNHTDGTQFATYFSPKGYACTLCAEQVESPLKPTIIDKHTLLNG